MIKFGTDGLQNQSISKEVMRREPRPDFITSWRPLVLTGSMIHSGQGGCNLNSGIGSDDLATASPFLPCIRNEGANRLVKKRLHAANYSQLELSRNPPGTFFAAHHQPNFAWLSSN
jgi:hypothetical protein